MTLQNFSSVLRSRLNLDRFDVIVDQDIRRRCIILQVVCRGCGLFYNTSIDLDLVELSESSFIDRVVETVTQLLTEGCTCWQRVRNEIRQRVRPVGVFEGTNIPDWVGDESPSSLESRRSSSEIPTTVREPEIEIFKIDPAMRVIR